MVTVGTGRIGRLSWADVGIEIPDGKRTAGESKLSSFLFPFSSIAATLSGACFPLIPISISSTSASSAASNSDTLISASHLAISLCRRKSFIFLLHSISDSSLSFSILSCSFSILCCSSTASFLILFANAFFRRLIEDVVEDTCDAESPASTVPSSPASPAFCFPALSSASS